MLQYSLLIQLSEYDVCHVETQDRCKVGVVGLRSPTAHGPLMNPASYPSYLARALVFLYMYSPILDSGLAPTTGCRLYQCTHQITTASLAAWRPHYLTF